MKLKMYDVNCHLKNNNDVIDVIDVNVMNCEIIFFFTKMSFLMT